MIITEATENLRPLKMVKQSADFVVVGGGLAGVCASIQAARAGLSVALIQDRPVLGGNASSEVRLWALGATSHMGNNNRWAREGGIIDEIVVENLRRNKEGNPVLFDALLIDKVLAESKITLLLDTAVFAAEKTSSGEIATVRAFNPQNSTLYEFNAPLFCDASGDGILGYLSGASFRVGAEPAEEFDEQLAPDQHYGELLGHTIYFYTKDAGKPVEYVAPDFALKDITRIPRFKRISPKDFGCNFWWFEYGGRLDTIHDTAAIKSELWKVVYGVWDYIKNSGKFDHVANLTLEWVGHIPGKRESRRFEGDYMINQKDFVEQRCHADAVSYGGWAVDLHPADGVYSDKPPCNQYHSRGVYQIPYRCLYSRDIPNLFLAGRVISASHVAFGSTRVMMTSAHSGQAVGTAAAICREKMQRPRDILGDITDLQVRLLRTGQFIPHLQLADPDDLCLTATIEASSTLQLDAFPANGETTPLDRPRAMLLPAAEGPFPAMTFTLSVASATELELQFRVSERVGNYTPDCLLAKQTITLRASENQDVTVNFGVELDRAQYVFVCLMPNENVSVGLSDLRVTGVLSVANGMNKAVAKSARQEAAPGSGIDSFDFWLPTRRPEGKNLAVCFDQSLCSYSPDFLKNCYERPFIQTNAWVADADDPAPMVTCRWESPQSIRRISLSFDSDFDHPMESTQMGHPESVVPFCIKHFRVVDERGTILFEDSDNSRSRVEIVLPEPVNTKVLRVEVVEKRSTPAALFRMQAFA
jgi:hypothetical protein